MIIGPMLIGLGVLLIIMAYRGTHLDALKVVMPSWTPPTSN
jgi:hypothetical protein